MKNPINLIIYITLLFLCFACNNQSSQINLGEMEYYFDEKLSSISEGKDGSIWIGSETGNLFSFKNGQYKQYDLYGDRIYKVKDNVLNNDSVLWVAMRNSGIQIWKKGNNNQLIKDRTFTISLKQDRYSPYDFIITDSMLYAATSLGFYKINIHQKENEMTLIYPSIDQLKQNSGCIFLVHNLSLHQDSIILASTPNGIMTYSINSGKIGNLLNGKNIKHAVVYNDTIVAISKDSAYSIINNTIKITSVDQNSYLYYQDKNYNHFFFAQDKVLVERDTKEYAEISLRRKIPSSGRNMVLPDTLNDGSYLLTENALWRIPNNIDIHHSNKAITVSGFDEEGNMYFVTDQNELYRKEKDKIEAEWLYEFNIEELVMWIGVSHNTLYMYTSNNTIYKMGVGNKWYKNIAVVPKLIYHSDAKITGGCLASNNTNKPSCYIGTQAGLLYISEKDSIRNIPALDGKYITSIFGHKSISRIYIGTLNDGVFYTNKEQIDFKQIPHTKDEPFIEDIISTTDHDSNLITLTNQYILSQKTNQSDRIRGLENLIYLNDSIFFTLSNFGVKKYQIIQDSIKLQASYFNDIQFKPKASFIDDNKLVLGSNLGCIIIDANNMQNPQWIIFHDALNVKSIVITTLVIILFLSLILYIIRIFQNRENAIRLALSEKQRIELLERLDTLSSYWQAIDGENKQKVQITEILTHLQQIDISFSTKQEIKKELDNVTDEIASLMKQISTALSNKLKEQISDLQEIPTAEAQKLIKDSISTKEKEDNRLVKDQIIKNRNWLKTRLQFTEELESDIQKLEGCYNIKDINMGIFDSLKQIKRELETESLSTLIDKYKQIQTNINNIYSHESYQKIITYVTEFKSSLLSEYRNNETLIEPLIKNLNILEENTEKLDNICILKSLSKIHNQAIILSTFQKIKYITSSYKSIIEDITEENNLRINKKFDKELANEISDKTKGIVEEVNTEIQNLYKSLPKEEISVITDTLKLSDFNSQSTKVLAILLADTQIKKSLIPGILGIYGTLNPVISRLINDRIKPNKELLEKRQGIKNNYSVFLSRLLSLST